VTTPLLGDLIRRAVEIRVDLKILPPFASRLQMPARLRQQRPGVVVIGLRPGEDHGIGGAVHDIVPTAIVVTISNDLKSACLHKLNHPTTALHHFKGIRLAAELARLVHPH
jgi:hypothetical protein